MKKRKLIPAVLTAMAMAAGNCVYALDCSPSSYVEDSQQWIRLDIEGDNPFEEIAVRIVKPGKVITQDMSFDDYKDSIIAMTTVTTDQDNKASKAVRVLDDIEEGTYTIDLVSSSGERASKEYTIISSAKILEQFEIICTSKIQTEVLEALNSYGEAIGLDVTALNGLEQDSKKTVAALYIKNRDNLKDQELTVETVQSLLDEAAAVGVIQNTKAADAKAVFETYEPLLKLKELDEYVKYMGFTGADETKLYQRVIDEKDTYTTIEALRDTAKTQILLYHIEAAGNWYNVRSIVKTYCERLGLNESEIDLDASIESEVYQALNGEEFENAEAFAEGFREAVEDAESEVSTPTRRPGGSGGSSGSGSGSGTMTRPIAPIPQDDVPGTVQTPQPQEIPDAGFMDVKEQTPWAEEAVSALCEKGILNGRSDQEFAPNDSVTREEFTKMIVLTAGYDTSGQTEGCSFEDADKGAWYYPYICTAYQKGLVKGKTQTSFGIGQQISRQEMAVLIYRMMGEKPAEVKADFSDFDQCADYAREAVSYLQASKIVNGREDNRFEPQASATRAEAAQMLYQALKVMENQ